jgi:protocatechuate 3,4-dioxygenase beta subunit
MKNELPSGIVLSTTTLKSIEDTPAVCPMTFVEEQTEGPFYKTGSKETNDIVDDKTEGVPFTLSGYVYDREGRPTAGAWLDFWQSDGNGIYDNKGYRLRGHQFTSEKGMFRLRTIIPGAYSGRTNHIHVKLSRSRELSLTEARGSITTTQLYFPGAKRNGSDGLFSPAMVVNMGKGSDGQFLAFFNFRLDQ